MCNLIKYILLGKYQLFAQYGTCTLYVHVHVQMCAPLYEQAEYLFYIVFLTTSSQG